MKVNHSLAWSHEKINTPRLLDFSLDPAEIWNAIHTAAKMSIDCGLTLGFMLAQVLKERPYKMIRCKNFKELCNKIGITDRKGRHLVVTALAWQDACQTIGSQLPPPANFALSEQLFLARETLSNSLYHELVTELYDDSKLNADVAKRLQNALREFAPPGNDFKADLKRIKCTVEVARMASVDKGFLDITLQQLSEVEESDFASLINCLNKLISQLESALTESASDHPVPLADRGRPNLAAADMTRHPSGALLRELH